MYANADVDKVVSILKNAQLTCTPEEIELIKAMCAHKPNQRIQKMDIYDDNGLSGRDYRAIRDGEIGILNFK